jgi:hypothetical protein
MVRDEQRWRLRANPLPSKGNYVLWKAAENESKIEH